MLSFTLLLVVGLFLCGWVWGEARGERGVVVLLLFLSVQFSTVIIALGEERIGWSIYVSYICLFCMHA